MNQSNLLFLVATKEIAPHNNLAISHAAENFLLETAFLLKIIIEYFALIILIIGIFKATKTFLSSRKKVSRPSAICMIRLDLGRFLILSLEFLLAADIAATAVSPSWQAIGKLAAISGVRTFLNYFLQLELKELENNDH